jgi:hypothetical protein
MTFRTMRGGESETAFQSPKAKKRVSLAPLPRLLLLRTPVKITFTTQLVARIGLGRFPNDRVG